MEVDKTEIRALTANSLRLEILKFKTNRPAQGSFIISDLIGTIWSTEYMPFYRLYGGNGKVAGQEMGKLLSRVAREMGLRSIKENRFEKRDAITRYLF